MASLDPVFGLHAQALTLQRQRMDVIAANIANADTPHYQPREVDFAAQLAATLRGAVGGGAKSAAAALSADDPRHLVAAAPDGPAPATRAGTVLQPSADGNGVDVQAEQAHFADAALHYQASLSFADTRLRSLLTAITGQ